MAVQTPPSQAAVDVVVTEHTKSASHSIVFRPLSAPVGQGRRRGGNVEDEEDVDVPPNTVLVGSSSSPTAVVVASTISVFVLDSIFVIVAVGSSSTCVVTLPVTDATTELADEMGEISEAVMVLVMLGMLVIVEAVTMDASCVDVAPVISSRREDWMEETCEEADDVSIGRAVSVSSAVEGATVAVTETVSVTTPPSCPCCSVGVGVAVTWMVDVSSPLGTTTTGTVLVTTPLDNWTTATVSVSMPLGTTTTAAVEVSMPSVTVSVSGGAYGATVYAVTLLVTVVTPDVRVTVVTPLFS